VLNHSFNSIAKDLSPVTDCQGIEVLETETFKLHCFQTLTGSLQICVVFPWFIR
jgi:hypothetical protein